MSYECYADVSQHYDRTREPIGVPILLGSFATMGRALSDLFVLDAGCGTASYSVALAKCVRQVVGIDASPEMIQQGIAKASAAQVSEDKLTLLKGDIGSLPFDDGRFDCVTVNQVLHHIDDDASAGFPQHARVLAELARVTRPDGVIVVNLCSHEQVKHGWWYRELFLRAFERLSQRMISIPELVKQLEFSGCTHQGTIVPVDAVFQGSAYFDAEGPLRESWRRGDSVFALATDDELQAGCSQIRNMRDAGTLSRFRAERDARRQDIGQVSFVVFKRSH